MLLVIFGNKPPHLLILKKYSVAKNLSERISKKYAVFNEIFLNLIWKYTTRERRPGFWFVQWGDGTKWDSMMISPFTCMGS